MRRPITQFQWKIYQAWLKNNQHFKETAKALGRQPEQIRRAVAAVKRKLKDGEKPPK